MIPSDQEFGDEEEEPGESPEDSPTEDSPVDSPTESDLVASAAAAVEATAIAEAAEAAAAELEAPTGSRIKRLYHRVRDFLELEYVIELRHWLRLVVRVGRLSRVRAYAGDVTYNGLFALIAAMALFVVFLTTLPVDSLSQSVTGWVDTKAPPFLNDAVDSSVQQAEQVPSIGSVSLLVVLTLVFTATRGLRSVGECIVTMGGGPVYPMVRSYVLAAILTIIFAVGMVTPTVGILLGSSAIEQIFAAMGIEIVGTVLGHLLAFILVWIFPPFVFFAVYRFADFRRGVHWLTLVPGALLAAIVWVGFTYLLRLFLVFGFDLDSFSAIPQLGGIMVYLYASSYIFLFGAVLNHVLPDYPFPLPLPDRYQDWIRRSFYDRDPTRTEQTGPIAWVFRHIGMAIAWFHRWAAAKA